jgi:hypothetical protein
VAETAEGDGVTLQIVVAHLLVGKGKHVMPEPGSPDRGDVVGRQRFRQVDAGDVLVRIIGRQGEAGADAHLQHTGAGQGVDQLDGAPPARAGDRAEDLVIDPGPAPIGLAHGFGIERRAGVADPGLLEELGHGTVTTPVRRSWPGG